MSCSSRSRSCLRVSSAFGRGSLWPRHTCAAEGIDCCTSFQYAVPTSNLTTCVRAEKHAGLIEALGLLDKERKMREDMVDATKASRVAYISAVFAAEKAQIADEFEVCCV